MPCYLLPADERELHKLLRGQRGMFTAEQARAAGMSDTTLTAWRRCGKLMLATRGVYRYPGPPLSYEDKVLAEILRLRFRAVASHRTALYLWDLASRPRDIDLIGRNRSTRQRLAVHESILDAQETTTVGGLPVTTPRRTLLDAAGVLGADALARVLGEALQRGYVTWRLVRDAQACHGHRRQGAGRILRALAAGPVTESLLEQLFEQLVTGAGLPRPQRQVPVPGTSFRLDFAYPDAGVGIELHGAAFHASPVRQRRDARKATAAGLAGFVMLEFTWHDVVDAPGRVVAQVRHARHLRAARHGRPSSATASATQAATSGSLS